NCSPQLQKVASEILYKLSSKNQVFFSTHSPNMIFNFNSKQIKQVVLDENGNTSVNENTDIDTILDDLGYSANDLMNVNFIFIVEGKQDSNRLPLLLDKYYSEIYNDDGTLQRVSIITTNSCTNIKTYANLKYINKLYLKDQFLMIRDSDGKDPQALVKQLCNYYFARSQEDKGNIPRIQPRNVLVLKYYSFENYFLNPEVMTRIGVIKTEEEFYNILLDKFKSYLHKLASVKHMKEVTGLVIRTKEDIKRNMETIKIFVRGHNLFDIFYGRYKGEKETEILKAYIDEAPRSDFADILNAIDNFIYFMNRRRDDEEDSAEMSQEMVYTKHKKKKRKKGKNRQL
nr:OLD family endonuclease [Lachnospiraceae bacterium]